MKKKYMLIAVMAIVLLVTASFGFAVTTNDMTTGGTVGFPAYAVGKTYKISKLLDFSSTAGVSNDIYEVLNIPAETWVAKVGYEIHTVEDSVCVVQIGDGSDRDGYFSDLSLSNGASSGVMTWSVSEDTRPTLTNATVSSTSDARFVTNVTATTGSFGTAVVLQQAIVTNVVADTTNVYAMVTNVTLTVSDAATGVLAMETLTALTATTITTQGGDGYPVASGTTAYAGGKWYSAADTIDVQVQNPCDTLKVYIKAWIVDLR